ncbi:MAG TPA: ABC transporter ATP-binding protein [Vicinamibacterales bacterium]|nr:ABC transporter ATP-binding protein [Vicinamibacterales bacterium]
MAVIDARAVSKRFLLRHNASVELKVRFLGLLHPERRQSIEEFWALRDVSLRIERGEAVGLVGRNGSGKSTFLKLIAAIHRPTSGHLLVARNARIASMIELGVGFHPELTGRENVFLNAAIHGLSRPDIEALYGAIVQYSGLEHFIDVPIKNYSSGMHMRLGFAVAANLNPDILLLDEIFAVGDADFQQRCIGTIRRFLEDGKTIIFVSHAPSAVRSICRRVCVLDQGTLAFDGEIESGLAFYEQSLVLGREAAAHAASGGGPLTSQGSPAAEPAAAREVVSLAPDPWLFDFLRGQGLQREHYLLELSTRSLPSNSPLAAFLEDRHYRVAVRGADAREADRAANAFDFDDIAAQFDFACAHSVFPRFPLNSVVRCIASVLRKLRPGGRFYATCYENPDPASFDPIARAPGVTTYPDRQPYHYPFELLASACAILGAEVERTAVTDPGGEAVFVITRRH